MSKLSNLPPGVTDRSIENLQESNDEETNHPIWNAMKHLDARLDKQLQTLDSQNRTIESSLAVYANLVARLNHADTGIRQLQDETGEEFNGITADLENLERAADDRREDVNDLVTHLDALDDRLHNLEQGARLQEERHTALAKRVAELERQGAEVITYLQDEGASRPAWEHDEDIPMSNAQAQIVEGN